MSAKGVITASMLYVVVLAILAKGWLANMRNFVQNASGTG